MILLVWACFTIRFLFFSYWDIVYLPPILLLLDGFQRNNDEQLSGDSDPEAIGRHTQEDRKFKKKGKHTASLDILIQIMIQEELLRIGRKSAEISN
ncbi:hypothetical protein TNIN_423441 [Trichonephila inaurata madagascariensis]|uniref:Uncharacterized protein n=1 Tax=Trichonephila inaurata madagascariensis TaxID=2747483 RepID=A0A8X6WUK8_9ARAC|nr:hypothetical protein TNIN_423441 [Trichonephila inaurata madagascariensis]